MEEIEVHPMWLKDEKELMERLGGLISGPNQTGPFKKPGDNDQGWQLDGGNNYWARIVEGKLQLSSRYGGEKFKVLVAFVRVWLGKAV
jgi:hypothetical protein